jgi:hypothetical protein
VTCKVVGDKSGGYFPVETPEGAGFCSPSRECLRSHNMTLISSDNGLYQNVEGVLKRIL